MFGHVTVWLLALSVILSVVLSQTAAQENTTSQEETGIEETDKAKEEAQGEREEAKKAREEPKAQRQREREEKKKAKEEAKAQRQKEKEEKKKAKEEAKKAKEEAKAQRQKEREEKKKAREEAQKEKPKAMKQEIQDLKEAQRNLTKELNEEREAHAECRATPEGEDVEGNQTEVQIQALTDQVATLENDTQRLQDELDQCRQSQATLVTKFCTDNTDCGSDNSAMCFHGRCVCSFGYVYSVSQDTCVDSCTHFVPSSYLLYPAGGINGNNKFDKEGSVEECQLACDADPQCHNFERRASTRECFFHYVAPSSSNWGDDSDWDSYQKNCA